MKNQNKLKVVLILTIITASFLIYSLVKYLQRADEAFKWVNHTADVIQNLQNLSADIDGIESSLKGYVTSKDASYSNDIVTRKSYLQHQVDSLESLIKDNDVQLANLRQLKKKINEKMLFLDEVVLLNDKSANQGSTLLLSPKERLLSDTLNRMVYRMQSEEKRLLQIRIEESKSITKTHFFFAAGIGMTAFIMLFVALRAVMRENRLRRLIEQRLVANESKYRGLIDNTAVVVFSASPEGLFTFINNKCNKLTGYETKELLGTHYLDLVPDNWKEKVSDFYKHQAKNGILETLLEFPIVTKEGSIKWVAQSTVILNEKDRIHSFQAVVIDVTAKMEMERQLSLAEQKAREEQELHQSRLQSILDNVPMIVYIKDLSGKFTLANKEYKRMFNLTESEIIGMTSHHVRTKVSKGESDLFIEKIVAADEEVKRTLKAVELEDELMTAEGMKNMLVTKFPLLDAEGKLIAICGIHKDITEMVKNRRQLIEARVRAENAERLQEEFLANMSHEIRTPMNGIVGMANLLSDTPLNKEQAEFVKIVKDSSDTLLMLINDILDLSKIKAGRMVVEKIDFNVREVLDKVIKPFEVKAVSKGVAIKMTVDTAVPSFVVGDQHKLIQILNNLLSNAVKFTSEGEVALYVKATHQNKEEVTLSVQVSDTGIGIAPEHLEYIYDSFVQAGNDMIRRFGGSGLGLAITKRLIELQQGTIDVQSTVGSGTCFTIQLPYVASEKKMTVATAETSQKLQQFTDKRILLVEDNEINQIVSCRILEKTGLSVEIACNGQEAITVLESGLKIDLIIMDLQMPVMNGFQATSYIRSKLKLDTPIIAMTASALRNEREKCFELGMNEYLSKPFVPEELVKHLTYFLGYKTSSTQRQVASDASPLYSLDYVNELQDNRSIAKIIQMLLDNTPCALKNIRQSYLLDDYNAVYQQAHKLKSSLSIFQMTGILEKLSEIEVLAKEERGMDKISELLKRSTDQYNLIQPMLKAELENYLN